MATRKKHIDLDRLRELHAERLSDGQIGKLLGCHGTNVSYHRKKLGLAAVAKKRAADEGAGAIDGLLAYIERGSERAIDEVQLGGFGKIAEIKRRIMADLSEFVEVRAQVLYASYVRRRRHELRTALPQVQTFAHLKIIEK